MSRFDYVDITDCELIFLLPSLSSNYLLSRLFWENKRTSFPDKWKPRKRCQCFMRRESQLLYIHCLLTSLPSSHHSFLQTFLDDSNTKATLIVLYLCLSVASTSSHSRKCSDVISPRNSFLKTKTQDFYNNNRLQLFKIKVMFCTQIWKQCKCFQMKQIPVCDGSKNILHLQQRSKDERAPPASYYRHSL